MYFTVYYSTLNKLFQGDKRFNYGYSVSSFTQGWGFVSPRSFAGAKAQISPSPDGRTRLRVV